MLLEICGFLTAVAGFCFTLAAIAPRWLRPRFQESYKGLLAQLDQEYLVYKAATEADNKIKLQQFLDVARKLGLGPEIDQCPSFYLIAGFTFVFVCGLIIIKASECVSNVVYVSVAEGSMYLFGFGAFFVFSIAIYHTFRIHFCLRKS